MLFSRHQQKLLPEGAFRHQQTLLQGLTQELFSKLSEQLHTASALNCYYNQNICSSIYA